MKNFLRKKCQYSFLKSAVLIGWRAELLSSDLLNSAAETPEGSNPSIEKNSETIVKCSYNDILKNHTMHKYEKR